MERCFWRCPCLVLVVSCIVLVIACQQEVTMIPVTDKSAIIGSWEAEGVTVEIFADGRIVHTDKRKKQTAGRYEFIDNNIIRIEYEGLQKQEYKASVYQSELLLTSVENSSTARLRRVN